MSDQATERGTFGARLLVIIYASALVYLGWQPIRRHYWSDIKRATANVADYLETSPPRRDAPSGVAAGELPPPKTRPPDSITKEDKRALQRVLDGLP